MKRTELPWKVKTWGMHPHFEIWGGEGFNQRIGSLQDHEIETEANAALIIEAVNNHHALKHACKLALDALTTTYENGKGVVDAQVALHAFGNLKAALDAAGKEV